MGKLIGVWAERLFGLTYPLVVHLCILAGAISFAVYWLATLLAYLALKEFIKHRELRWWMIALASCAAALLWSAAVVPETVIYLPPVLINLALLLVFGRTLLPGQTPLITRLALLMDQNLSAAASHYTRSVTWVWAVYFLLMTISAIILAVVAPVEIWSAFANFLQYLMVPLLFVAEFQVRRQVLGKEVDYGFITFLKRLLVTID